MATWDGKDSSIIANRFGNVYIKDYMDISGRLFVRRDASLNSRLFVMNDASFMGNLYVDRFLNENANFTVNGDVSLNGRLMVAKDASFQSFIPNTRTDTSFTLVSTGGPLSFPTSNSILRGNTGGSAGRGYNAYVNQLLSSDYFLTARIVNTSDVNYGGKWIGFFTASSSTTPYFGFKFGGESTTSVVVYFNGSIESYTTTYVVNDIFSVEVRSTSVSYYKNNVLMTRYFNPNIISLYPVFRMEYRALPDTIDLISIGTVSTLSINTTTITINGNLTANLNFRVYGDASLNSNVIVGRDISCNGNIRIGRNLIVGGNLAVKNYTTQNIINTTTTNYQLVIAEDLSLNGRLAVSSDTSLNGNLFVAGDISCNGNLNVGRGIFLRDISVNGITIGIGSGGFTNTIFGNLALASNSAGINNTAVGYAALRLNTASDNTACGYNALASNTTGINNTAVGSGALSSNTTGCNNTAIGYNAGSANVDGSFNTYIGYNANADAGNYSYSTAIGANALITGSNQIVLGTSAETVVIPGKIRHATSPLIFYRVSSQTYPANSTTTVVFNSPVDTGVYTNIGYNSSTGVFTNNNPYTVCVSITVSIRISVSTTANTGMITSIVSSAYGVVSSNGVSFAPTTPGATSCSATIPLAPNDTFYTTFKNTTATSMTVINETNNTACIMIRVF
jgi:hypothetical protein